MGVTEAIQVALADYGVRYGKDTTAETWGTEARAKVASAAKALKVSDERLCQAFVRAAEAPGANPTWPPRPNAVLQVVQAALVLAALFDQAVELGLDVCQDLAADPDPGQIA